MMVLDGAEPNGTDANDDLRIGDSELGVARAALRRAMDAAIALDVVGFEEQPTRELSELEDAVEAAVLLGRSALGLIADLTNGDDQEAPVLDERHSGVHPLGVGRLADTVFVGRMVLGSVVPEVMRARVKEHWDRIDACDNARRELLQTLRAVDLALCRVADIAPNLDYYEQEAELAHQIRMASIKLHDAINKRPELVDADRVVATRALALLGGPRPELSQVVSLLRAMRGRDAELDALLEQANQDPEPLSERVAAVVEELGGRATSTFLGALKRS